MRRMPEAQENELVLMAQKGSTKAFTELEKQYHWLVFKVAKGILCEASGDGSIADAEDATQDAFEYAFVHIKEYKPGRFYRWLWSVGRVSALRLRSKLWKRQRHETEFDEERIPNINEVDFSRNSWDEAVNEIDRYIKDHGGIPLTKRQRQDFELYVEGFKPREIAKRTGRNANAVRVSIHTAKKRVKEKLMICPEKVVI